MRCAVLFELFFFMVNLWEIVQFIDDNFVELELYIAGSNTGKFEFGYGNLPSFANGFESQLLKAILNIGKVIFSL